MQILCSVYYSLAQFELFITATGWQGKFLLVDHQRVKKLVDESHQVHTWRCLYVSAETLMQKLHRSSFRLAATCSAIVLSIDDAPFPKDSKVFEADWIETVSKQLQLWSVFRCFYSFGTTCCGACFVGTWRTPGTTQLYLREHEPRTGFAGCVGFRIPRTFQIHFSLDRR